MVQWDNPHKSPVIHSWDTTCYEEIFETRFNVMVVTDRKLKKMDNGLLSVYSKIPDGRTVRLSVFPKVIWRSCSNLASAAGGDRSTMEVGECAVSGGGATIESTSTRSMEHSLTCSLEGYTSQCSRFANRLYKRTCSRRSRVRNWHTSFELWSNGFHNR